MCGIAGIVGFGDALPPEVDLLERMARTIHHRGPDDSAIHVRDRVGLVIQRLSIIDVDGGMQPLFNEDRTVRTVYNGEIYNYRELREQLRGSGHRFATNADTEVIVHAWEQHGSEFPRALNGMFAIALHDRDRGRFVLVRDRLGIKPLYYAVVDNHLVFGSEVKALLASGLVPRRLDVDAVGQFLAWEYVPGARTLLRDVRCLEPGQMLEVDLERPRFEPRTWWELPTPEPESADPRDAAGWQEAIDAKVHECVKRQLVSDVPLGAFLSGGVDSSLMVAAMGEARTFSIGFDDPSYNETPWARRVADHLGVSHRQEIIRPRVVELFEPLMEHLDDPIGDFSIFPTYLVSRLAREEVKVVLSGDGGDEVFGGYETYVAQRLARTWSWLPRALRAGAGGWIDRLRPRPEKKGLVNLAKRFVEGTVHAADLGHARWRLFAGEAVQQRLFTPEAAQALETPIGAHVLELGDRADGRSAVDKALYVDLKSYLCDNILVKVDRMSMACSLEARVPYLDHELVELAFRMPAKLKVAGRSTKVMLKRVAAQHVPRECVYRAKEGFSIPVKNWLNGAFRPLLEEHLEPQRLRSEGLFEPTEVERLKREHLAGEANHSHVLWSLLVFKDWRRRWGV